MNKSYFLNAFQRISDWVFFLVILLYQLLFIFQGLDFADEGFYATFYQQIFKHPQSVSFNFMYWFSGIIGGSFYYFFPSLGLLGFRLLGIIVVTSTIGSVYFLLKKYLNLIHLRLGIILLLFFISNDPKEMYYNNLSAFLFVISAIFLFYGVKSNKLIFIFLSGAALSLNMFSRLPSVIGLVLILVIPYFGFLSGINIKNQLKQIFTFFIGFISLTATILLTMKFIGHLGIFLDNLKITFGMGTESDSGNNLIKLIKLFISDYSSSIISGFLLISFIIILGSINKKISVLTRYNPKTVINSMFALIIIVCFYFTMSHKISWLVLLRLFTGLSIIISVLIIFSNSFEKEIKLLSFLGCIVLFAAPFGSGGGIYMAGRYSLWIVFPIAIDFLLDIKSVENEIKIISGTQERLINFSIDNYYLNQVKRYFIAISILICLYYSYFYPYFDMSNRSKMSYPIENNLVKGIFTTHERALVINELLSESNKFLKKNDYLFAYSNIPMIHFLTETRPYLNNSWPYF
jgi:hypothetical protein